MLGVGGWDAQCEDPEGANKKVMALIFMLVLAVTLSYFYEQGCFTKKGKVEKKENKEKMKETEYNKGSIKT